MYISILALTITTALAMAVGRSALPEFDGAVQLIPAPVAVQNATNTLAPTDTMLLMTCADPNLTGVCVQYWLGSIPTGSWITNCSPIGGDPNNGVSSVQAPAAGVGCALWQ